MGFLEAMRPKQLTTKQEAFCRALVEGLTATDAYYRSYPTKGNRNTVHKEAMRTLRSPLVKARMDELKGLKGAIRETLVQELANPDPAAKLVRKVVVEKLWVTEKLIEIVEDGMAKTSPVLDRYGKPTGEFRQNLNAANKALELIGKELGMFVERTMNVKDPLADLTHEEVKELLAVLEKHDDGTSAGPEPAPDKVQPIRAGRVTH